MGKTLLVRFPLIEEGQKLVETLEQEGLLLKAAFWLYFDEANEWRLALASPLVDEEGPRRVYERIQQTLNACKPKLPIPLSNISALSPDDAIVKPLREALDERESNQGFWVKSSVITGKNTSVYLEEAYIYFARK